MKLLSVLMLGFCMTVHATTLSQEAKVSLHVEEASLNDVLQEVGKQVACDFLYDLNLMEGKVVKNLDVKDKEFLVFLNDLLPRYGLMYSYDNNIVVIKVKEEPKDEKKMLIIRGKVTDEKKAPLPGVTVVLKGTSRGTATDMEGRYTLPVPKADVIEVIFSFLGMETQTVAYTGKDTINVVLKESLNQLDEVVVVNTGYEQVDKRKLTSAITSIKADDIRVPGLNTIDMMLEGHVPGMMFLQNSGQLGAAPRLRIRGTSTLLGNQEPLWVVDGIVRTDPVDVDPTQLNDLDFVNLLGNAISGLDPESIEQIDVLKDASATAIYGARAANGVIVITTKKGRKGAPSVSYALSGTFTRRPHYGDRNVYMMNSKERIAYSREMDAALLEFPSFKSWVGYEGVMRDYYQNRIDFNEMNRQIGYLEQLNTDWFGLLGQNSFSHKHTIGVSGGGENVTYYASIGYNDAKGTTKREANKSYTANMSMSAHFNRFSVQAGMDANAQEREYTPQKVNVMNYAYHTSRAVPATNPDGSYWFYKRGDYAGSYFNILNEVENSSYDINQYSFNFNTTVGYQIIDPLKLSATLAYGFSNSNQETWYGEKSYYIGNLRQEIEGATADGSATNYCPMGGEIEKQSDQKHNYMLRLQLSYAQTFQESHNLSAMAGFEVSSSESDQFKHIQRGYMRDRGGVVAKLDDIGKYTNFVRWMNNNPSTRRSLKSNLLSGYGSVSYAYKMWYVLNANIRFDQSNQFGSRANEKLAPIWSFSGRWNVKENILEGADWINELSLLASYGYQGNMLASESSRLVVSKEGSTNAGGELYAKIMTYPNPDLKWEKTSSTNVSLTFSLFKRKLNGTVSYFYKKTRDAFLTKTISTVNGRSSYTMNKGTVENKGTEISLKIVPLDFRSTGNVRGFHWSIDPQLGSVLNQLLNKKKVKDNSLQDTPTYDKYLKGSVLVVGRPVNTFYSYRFAGLSERDGRPMFYNTGSMVNGETERGCYVDANGLPLFDINEETKKNAVDLREKYRDMEREDVFMEVMEHSGTRVPTIQGGISNTFSYKGVTLSFNLAYSLGSKVRLLQMYPNVNKINGSIAPIPTENVRKEFANRWRQPGDERYTNIPGVLSGLQFTRSLFEPWCDNNDYKFADNIWQMYDNSNIRVASGNFLKMQSLSLRYQFTDGFCRKFFIKSAYIGFACTNLFMICDKKLKGQDPATQSGSAPELNMSLRPTFSFNLNVSF
ncbi:MULTISPECIES: SusC/RagA family TonB-linked outer membrane protein [Butyricimonas]|uniref:SusC/RagA family TonB-linked outer membrane protein n=1 Tax=Butyricimonas TaxID=574697 RepID=UPI001D094371|nr:MULTISPECIES: SusC/RagA family TonB-linked outer membrane protein [Butyricimonas]MCB6974284.1 SusC/RagA family TonB-linked outer membrane protein [Butyricimonas synergistica]MCG4521156.1 SusC/RagA family TonB-linked outer membrane protein [Butyricimonas sp. DFI.6.44]